MRTTIELPDAVYRRVEETAASQGVKVEDFISIAVRERLAELENKAPPDKPWMKYFGIFRDDPEMKAELDRIDKIVEETFEQIEEDEWR